MEVSALRYSGGIGLHARSPLLRLQSDERLVSLIRRGSTAAFEVLVARYNARLLAFCRHLLGSREDAEDVLQEVFSAAFNAILDDDRPINVRPWLYRIARNRSLNHLRRIQAVGVDSMDIHLSDHGSTTADKVHEREEFRLLVGDIQGLPETQRTALVLREMDALSYEQIAEAMETTVPSVKSLLVRARVSLAEASQARMLTCEEVREELAEVAEGLLRRPGPLVRRHLRACERCSTFKSQLNETSKALAAVLPIGVGVGGPLIFLRKLAILHIGHSAGAGSSASGASAAGQAAAVGSTAAAGASAVMGSGSTGFISASVGAIATKAAAGLAAAALVTAGAVEVDHSAHAPVHHHAAATQLADLPSSTPAASTPAPAPVVHTPLHRPAVTTKTHVHKAAATATTTPKKTLEKPLSKHTGTPDTTSKTKTKALPGRTQTQTVATVLPAQTTTSTVTTTPASTCTDTSESTTSATTTPTTTTTTPETSSDPGSTDTTTTTTPQSTTPGAASDAPGTSTDPSTSTPTDTSTQPTSTSSTPPPAPALDSGTSCASDDSSPVSPSGGTAP
ncbi:MAG TPA: sigma-70 family RNA polymerase sigma factor [Solirubrobacteraceae bacterium]|nr:sigma-70 family RNA polymerase sigma factor [Solirubrobacteraceae bacterium]